MQQFCVQQLQLFLLASLADYLLSKLYLKGEEGLAGSTPRIFEVNVTILRTTVQTSFSSLCSQIICISTFKFVLLPLFAVII